MKRIVFIDGLEYSHVETNQQFKSLIESNYKKDFLEPVVQNLYEIFKNKPNKSLSAFCENIIQQYICYGFQGKEEKKLSIVSYNMPCYLKEEIAKISVNMADENESE